MNKRRDMGYNVIAVGTAHARSISSRIACRLIDMQEMHNMWVYMFNHFIHL